jgi:glycerophosphoryl diester phosphodiesterase
MKKLPFVFAGAVLAGLGIYFLGPPWKNDICMIGHRGYSGVHQDNTALAFAAAAEHGFGGCETDVRITKDGQFVCNHNAEVKFHDGTELLVAEHSLEELKAKPLFNEHNNGEVPYICTFVEYLEIMRDNNMICFVELKGEFPKDKIKEMFELADEIYDLSMVELQSFEIENLKIARELFPQLRVMLTWGQDRGPYTEALNLGFNIDANINASKCSIVKDFHRRGQTVGFWTCNDIFRLRKAQWRKPDYIESDFFGQKKR